MAVTLLGAQALARGDAARLRDAHADLRAAHAADRMLFINSDKAGTEVLPQTALARNIAHLAHAVGKAAGVMPLLARALDAALLDAALIAAANTKMPEQLGFAGSSAIAYCLAAGSQFAASSDVPNGMAFELLCSLETPVALKGETGGVAVVTAAPGDAAAEAVGVAARSAALAQLCASAISRAVTPPAGELSAEVVWDTLGVGARVASALRSAGHLRGAVLTFRGRGRAIGPLEGDRLLRFGVSNWR